MPTTNVQPAGYYTDTTLRYYPNTWDLKSGTNPVIVGPTRDATQPLSGDYLSKPLVVKTVRAGDGWRKPTGYSLTKTLTVNPSGEHVHWNRYSATHERVSRVGVIGKLVGPADTAVPVFPTSVVARAEIECLLKLKDQNVNYAMAVAQAGQSVGLITSNATTLARALAHAKRGRWKQAAAALKISPPVFKKGQRDTSGRWLELQYGWLPLLGDIHGAALDLERGLSRLSPRISVTRTIKMPLKGSYDVYWDKLGFTHKVKQSGVWGCKVRLDYTVNNAALAMGTKLGVTNPLYIAWDLLPYSFVVDWFIPIGDWLDAMDADFGLTFKGGTKTIFHRRNRKGTVDYKGSRNTRIPATGRYVEFAKASWSWDHFSMVRSVYAGTPFPVPRFSNPFSVRRAISAIALLRLAFK